MVPKKIPISAIKDDQKYCFHFDLDQAFITNSIKEIGILTPLRLLENKGYFILDGYRRFRAARDLGFTEVPAIIFSENGALKGFSEAFHLNFCERDLSAIEKLRVFHISRNFNSLTLMVSIADQLNLFPFSHLTDLAEKVMQLPRWLQKYYHRMKFSIKILEKLSHFPHEEYENWFRLAESLKLKGIEILQLLDPVREICIRDRVEASQLWEKLLVKNISKSEETISQKSLKLKQMIQEARFPVTSSMNKNIKFAVSRAAKRSAGKMHLSWDKTLEKPGFYLNYYLQRDASVDELIQLLRTEEFQKEFKNLFSLTSSLPNNIDREDQSQ